MFSWAKKLLSKIAIANQDEATEILQAMTERGRSFSLILLKSDTEIAIDDFLLRCGYSILNKRQYRGGLDDLYNQCEIIAGDQNNLVTKATIHTQGLQIIFDPEMVLFTRTDLIRDWCRELDTTATATIWERVSQTIILSEFSGSGLLRQTWSIEGDPQPEQLSPHQPIMSNPSLDGLLNALHSLDIPLEDILAGELTATVFDLNEK